jgi:hypothetical protein
LFEFACLIIYAFVFPKLPIVKYYRSKAAAEGSKTVASDLAAAGLSTEVQGQQVPTCSDVQSFASPPAAWLVMCVGVDVSCRRRKTHICRSV